MHDRSENGSWITYYAWYALGVLTLIYVISVVDRQILAILANDIKKDLGLDDASVGFLYGTAFAAFYAIFGIPLGRLADKWHRGRLLALGLIAWSLMTVLSGFATSFTVLAIARIGVGIGEATSAPASYSLISDYFPQRKRATAMSIYASGLYFGFGLSLLIGSFVSSRWKAAFPDHSAAPFQLAGWQAAFVAVGVPGLFVAFWALSLREPRHATMPSSPAVAPGMPWREFGRDLVAILPPFTLISAAGYAGELRANLALLGAVVLTAAALIVATGSIAQWAACGVAVYAVASWVRTLRHRDRPTYLAIWGNRTIVTLILSFGSIAFISFATTFWAPAYALRTFYTAGTAPGRYLTSLTASEEVGLIVGASSAIASGAGVIIGGILADWWRQRHAAGRLYTVMLSLVLSAPLIWLMFCTGSLGVFFIAGPLAVGLGSAWSGAAIATVQDLVPARMRASAGAAFILGITMVGLALGPYVAGKIGTMTGELRIGVLALYVVAPVTLFALWKISMTIAAAEAAIKLSEHEFATASEAGSGNA